MDDLTALENKIDALTKMVEELISRPDETNKQQSLWLSTSEIADLMGIASSTLHRWRAEGSGPPCVKLRGALRYERAAVQAWMATR